MARVRHVWPASKVTDLWVSRTQEEARTPTHNLSYESAVDAEKQIQYRYLYSYQTLIANIVEQVGKPTVALITTRRYSTTTSGQLSDARRSLRKDPSIRVIELPFEVIKYIHAPIMTHAWEGMIEESMGWYAKAGRARSNRDHYMGNALVLMDDANYMAERFEIPVPPVDGLEDLTRSMEAFKAYMKLRSL